MGIKFNLSQKLLIIIAAVLFISGLGKYMYCRFNPLGALLFSIGNLTGSAGFEQDIQAYCRFGAECWDNGIIPVQIINDIIITANYKKVSDVSKTEFTLISNDTQKALLNGALYSDLNLAALALNGKTLYSKQERQAASDFFNIFFDISENLRPYLEYRPGIPVTINDYNRPAQMVMDNFLLIAEDEGSIKLLNAIIRFLDKNWPGISTYLKQIPTGSAKKIYAMFQMDDFMRLRGIHAEFHFNEAAAVIDMNTTRISRDIYITPPDITNGLDINQIFEDETDSLLKEFFDKIAGG